MQTFTPVPIPLEAPEWFRTWATEFTNAMRKAAAAENNYTSHKVLHAEPTRMVPSMLIYADGVDFNPGSGEGLYRRNSANTAWVFVG